MSNKIGRIAVIAPRLANLVRRLGSNHDGEIIATARAIERTLVAAGLDLHALADVIEATSAKSCPPQSAPRQRYSDESNDDLINLGGEHVSWREAIERIISSDIVVSKWEAEFLESIQAWRGTLTSKQLSTLRKIASRVKGHQHA